MGMLFCRGCGKQIHDTAPNCPHCGAPQDNRSSLPPANRAKRTTWAAIISLILGIVAMLAMLDDSQWDMDTYLGVGMFAVGGIAFGAIDLSGNTVNRGTSITGIVLSGIALLLLVGTALA